MRFQNDCQLRQVCLAPPTILVKSFPMKKLVDPCGAVRNIQCLRPCVDPCLRPCVDPCLRPCVDPCCYAQIPQGTTTYVNLGNLGVTQAAGCLDPSCLAVAMRVPPCCEEVTRCTTTCVNPCCCKVTECTTRCEDTCCEEATKCTSTCADPCCKEVTKCTTTCADPCCKEVTKCTTTCVDPCCKEVTKCTTTCVDPCCKELQGDPTPQCRCPGGEVCVSKG
uniref:Uncharacterized protein n=1 Tax=Falco tinnunculus TaxID=100819 RepID=A0A8C4USK5_FALTI